MPQIVTPRACEAIDLSGGRTYEIGWTTNGTGCETPWKLCVVGSPATEANGGCVELSTDVTQGISSTGGVIRLNASNLTGITSDTGYYHLVIASFYGSHLGSVAFRVKK